MEAAKNEKRIILYVGIIVIVSFLCNMLIKSGISFDGLRLDKNEALGADTFSRIMYVALCRAKQLFILYLLFKVFDADRIFDILLIIMAVFFALANCTQIFYSGMEGIRLVLIYLLPQMFIYYFVVKLLYGMFKYNTKDKYKLKCILYIFVLMCVGILVESTFAVAFLRISGLV